MRRDELGESTIRRLSGMAAGLAIVLAMLVFPPAIFASAGPFEPNDNIPEAAGPLLAGTTIRAALESEADRDFYFLYVGAASGGQATLTVEDLGGGSSGLGEINASVTDTFGTYIGGDYTYMRAGESRTDSISLQPGKYLVEIVSDGGYGQEYALAPHTGGGAFVSYGDVTASCRTKTARGSELRRQLDRLQTRLQLAIDRVRRSRFSDARSRRAARQRYLRLKTRVAAKRRALHVARGEAGLLCSIRP